MKYRCVTTIEAVWEYIDGSNIVALDFETAPDEEYREDEKAALDPARAHIVGCSISVKEGTGIYIPVAHHSGANMDECIFINFMQKLLMDTTITKVIHNIAFESSMAYKYGIIILPPVYDTLCASQLTLKNDFEYRKLADSGLKTLAKKVCDEELPTFSEVTAGRYFDELDGHDQETIRYGCADSDFALRLYYIFNEWFDHFIPRHRYIVEELESPAAVYIGIMKYNGIPLDISLMQQRKSETENEREKLRKRIQDIVGDIKIGANCSTQVFKDYLFVDLGLPVLKTTEKGLPAVDDEAMMRLKEWCNENRPELVKLFEYVQEYRKWGKIESTYIDGYMRYVNSVTGRVHPDIMGLATDTGRMACRNPNAQNMPRKTNDPVGVRSFIKAPAGQMILSLDFSQIELRVGAFYCRDKLMMETYQQGGDIHAATTSVIFGVSYEEAQDKKAKDYKEHRMIAKNVNFGTFYGLFPKGLQRTLKFKAGVDKTVEECEEILRNLKQGYKGLTAWQEDAKDEARSRIYSETWLGRRRYLPDILSDDWGKRAFAERCALNTPIQGMAADILKLAIGRILKGLPTRTWLKPILQIHDELVFIVPEERVNEAVCFIRECMEAKPFPEFDLPLESEASVGKSYGNMEEIGDEDND